ncbi:DUF6082 family protein [Streptomyces hydrogenans]|uniref:DUF6082 family protein n=1 Tax=Streptomyces hydrogenans TaxID=1873719 RepID=UPI0035D84842
MKLTHAITIAAGACLIAALGAERRHQERQDLADKHHKEVLRRATEGHDEATDLSRSQHQRQLRLGVAALHQQLLADIAADPAHREIWGRDGMSPEQLAESVRVNRQISLTQSIFELELCDLDELHVRARALMEREAVRRFWAATRDFRLQESQTPESREFIEVLDYAHVTACGQSGDKAPAGA